MNILENLVGDICKILLPIHDEVYFGNKESSIAICTLSSIDLLRKLAKSDLLQNVAIIGRLFSENKGIESLIQSIIDNPKIKTIILCGNEVWGHKAGHSLLELYKNGLDEHGKIINSSSPTPFIKISKSKIKKFQTQVKIIDMIGETNQEKILQLIKTI